SSRTLCSGRVLQESTKSRQLIGEMEASGKMPLPHTDHPGRSVQMPQKGDPTKGIRVKHKDLDIHGA
ncbi:MAG TPA: hypothetical protein PLX59_07030, partial [Candidatus Cloacimonadota bacterium]|nr:hypothetical protein [Candidatus Cloacimonadota bacterium]